MKNKARKRKRIGKPMSFRFTEEGLSKLRELADADMRSMASMLEIIIRDAHASKKPTAKKE